MNELNEEAVVGNTINFFLKIVLESFCFDCS